MEFLKLVILKLNPKLESDPSVPATDTLNLGSKVSWCMPIILAFGRLRQEDGELEPNCTTQWDYFKEEKSEVGEYGQKES